MLLVQGRQIPNLHIWAESDILHILPTKWHLMRHANREKLRCSLHKLLRVTTEAKRAMAIDVLGAQNFNFSTPIPILAENLKEFHR